ncbi:hypothetical protein [Salinarimonas soli]|uniref:hypothetical protein n=1 Tax=Salinarimonas soli TaxID=1638099 RepID=UPI001661D8F1|nr:hypothetical protein [Salinarimonas soli]
MILWAALVTLAASLTGLLALGPVQVLGQSGVLELVIAMSLFTVICAAEARG